jgi:hypothetical protein
VIDKLLIRPDEVERLRELLPVATSSRRPVAVGKKICGKGMASEGLSSKIVLLPPVERKMVNVFISNLFPCSHLRHLNKHVAPGKWRQDGAIRDSNATGKRTTLFELHLAFAHGRRSLDPIRVGYYIAGLCPPGLAMCRNR